MTVCRNCGGTAPEDAKDCPNCGARIAPYTPEETEAYVAELQHAVTSTRDIDNALGQRRTFTAKVLISIFAVIIVLAVLAVVLPPDDPSPTPTPAPAPAEPQSQSNQPSLDCSADLQSERLDFIQDCIDLGLFQKVERPAQYAHVWVAPGFYDLTFDDKEAFVSVVYAYHLCDDRTADIVVLYDSRTGKEIGVFSEVYAGLKLN